MPGADILNVDIVEKAFAGRPVLAGIRFHADQGEIVALLAPSGTGKTTALRIILGLDEDFIGQVQRPPGRAGAVFQDPRLLPWMDVADNVRLGAPSLTRQHTEALLQLVGLQVAAGAMPRELSLGMARRVAIARALAVCPSLLVLDEPFASLDARLATTLSSNIMARSRQQGCVVLFATHGLDQAMAVADRILVLSTTSPATLAADMRVSDCRSQDIRARFPFLSSAS